MFLSQIASACHYLHSKHIVHGNLRAVYVYVESPDKVTFRLHFDWIRQIFQKCVIVFLSRYDQDFFESSRADPLKCSTFWPIYIYISSSFSRFFENNFVKNPHENYISSRQIVLKKIHGR